MLNSIKRKLNSIPERDNNNYEITIQLLKRGQLVKPELEFLMKNFGNLKFFEEQKAKLPLYLYTQIYKNLDYQYVQQCETVFNFGDMGSTFYIILKGQVNVQHQQQIIQIYYYSQKHFYFDFQSQYLKSQQKLNNSYLHYQKSYLSIVPKPHIQDNLKYDRVTIEELQQRIENEKPNQFSDFDEFLQVVYQDFIKVRNLSAGDTFGDYALITKSKRSATILCQTDCHFMIHFHYLNSNLIQLLILNVLKLHQIKIKKNQTQKIEDLSILQLFYK